MTTQAERFCTILTGQYEYLFTLPQYAVAASKSTPRELAENMCAALAKGAADKSGEGVKRTCAVLGVKHTYTAIKAYLVQTKPSAE